jgi:hypothetical protein
MNPTWIIVLSVGTVGIPVGGEMACGRVVGIPVAVVAVASVAVGEGCVAIVAGSQAVVPESVPVGRIDVNAVLSVAVADPKVLVAPSVTLAAPPAVKLPTVDDVGEAVAPVPPITVWPNDVANVTDVLLSEVVIVPPTMALLVVTGGGALVTTVFEPPPVGTPEV